MQIVKASEGCQYVYNLADPTHEMISVVQFEPYFHTAELVWHLACVFFVLKFLFHIKSVVSLMDVNMENTQSVWSENVGYGCVSSVHYIMFLWWWYVNLGQMGFWCASIKKPWLSQSFTYHVKVNTHYLQGCDFSADPRISEFFMLSIFSLSMFNIAPKLWFPSFSWCTNHIPVFMTTCATH